MNKLLGVTVGATTGILAGIGATAALLVAESIYAFKAVGIRKKSAPYTDCTVNKKIKGTSYRIGILGDSLATGLGASTTENTIPYILATNISNKINRPVKIKNIAAIGAQTKDLNEQIEQMLQFKPNIALIIIGANDVTHGGRSKQAGKLLNEGITKLKTAGITPIVGLCPDVSSLTFLKPPLKFFTVTRAKRLNAAQKFAVTQAGGFYVDLATLNKNMHTFKDMWYDTDNFHPSDFGYAQGATFIWQHIEAIMDKTLTAVKPQLTAV